MPVIRIDFDDESVPDNDVQLLSGAIQRIVCATVHTEGVLVYANSSRVKVNASTIQVVIQVGTDRIDDVDVLLKQLTDQLARWKSETMFKHKIAMILIPMNWKIVTGI